MKSEVGVGGAAAGQIPAQSQAPGAGEPAPEDAQQAPAGDGQT